MSTLVFLILSLCLFPSYVVSQNPIHVDDSFTYSPSSPSGIQYSPEDWTDRNPVYAAQRFMGTYHVSDTQGAFLTFFFRGRSISYIADKSPAGGPIVIALDTPGGPTATVSGLSENDQFQFQQQIWSWAGLDSGDHQITIYNPDKSKMGLDFFLIIPNEGSTDVLPVEHGPGASNVPPNAILIDNRDQSIVYSGSAWEILSDEPGQPASFQGSMHSTDTPGDRCIFTFNGTGVWYFTDYRPGNAIVSISIDGSQGENVNTSPTDDTARTQRLAWGKSGLSSGVHVVTITHVGGTGSDMSLDFFKYTPSDGLNVASSVAASSLASTQPAISTILATPTAILTSTPAPATPTQTFVTVLISVSTVSASATSAPVATPSESKSRLSVGGAIGVAFGGYTTMGFRAGLDMERHYW
ncbi:hypothetical protein FRC09_007935 [Ceratobasidium sp. 395]|nr:hypothetical protein FRC09_007935 [Ceratobasidium sp. 395]